MFGPEEGIENRAPLRVLTGIVGLGLLLRLTALALFPSLTFPDTGVYVHAGLELFSGRLVSNDIYMPLYPLWAHVWGGGLGLKLADIAISTATIIVVFRLAEHVSRSVTAGLVAALLTALYPYLVFFSIARLTESLYIFLTCAAFLALYKDRFFLGSVLLVFAILTRPTLDYLAPILILLFSLVVLRQSWRKAAVHLVSYALVYLLLLTPWWVHNHYKYGEFVRLTLGDGVVLYSGNNPLNTTGGGVTWEQGDQPVDMNLNQFDRIADPVAQNQAMKEAAFEFIRNNPGRFVELAGLKFIRFWRLWPYADNYNTPFFIAASVLSFGPVLLLSVLSLFFAVPRAWQPLAPLLLYIGYLTAVHMVTIGSVRYRIPLAPFLIILASMQAMMILQRWPAANRLIRRLAGSTS